MHAFLIVGNSEQLRSNKVNEIALEQKAKKIQFALQKIEDVKNLKKFVKFKFNEKTAIVINNIDKVTTEAANAFLKNLEEPNNNLIYILTTNNITNVLPTIASRCQVIQVKQVLQVKQVKKTNYKDGLNIKDREIAIKFVEDLIYSDYQKDNFLNMENYLYTLRNLKVNGNVALQMTNLVVRMNSNVKTARI